jgi:TatA/E family protein of Tat protein translocase
MYSFLLFFNISGGEILVILVVVYLVFGPKKIPELARMLGKGLNELRRATQDIRDEISREANKIKDNVNIDLDDPLNFTESKSGAKKQEKPSEKKEEPSQPKDQTDQTNSEINR